MLGLRTSEEGPEHSVHLADNVRIVDHDVSVNAANNYYRVTYKQWGKSEIRRSAIKEPRNPLYFPKIANDIRENWEI